MRGILNKNVTLLMFIWLICAIISFPVIHTIFIELTCTTCKHLYNIFNLKLLVIFLYTITSYITHELVVANDACRV